MGPDAADFVELLSVLHRHEVEFLVVGGVCAVLHGAPVSTFDLDIVHSRSETNLTKLAAALADLDAFYRERPDARLRPDRSLLGSGGHHLLMTRAGPLDVLGTVGEGTTYEDLIDHSVEFDIGSGIRVRAVDLPTLIRLKESLGRERDRAVLPILRRTLDERG